jgi:hypothetical protein
LFDDYAYEERGCLMSDDFLYRDIPAFKKKLFRLGLATNYGIAGVDLERALDMLMIH